jgi:photosystem II stability/assembly factor-like uncharacterized protein
MGGNMKKFCLVFLLIIAFISSVNSQPYGWFTLTSGTANNLYGVYFSDPNTGLVVGQGGTVLRTTNGGTNFAFQSTGTPNHLFGVFFINNTTGYIAGDVGLILKTTNGGANWGAQNSGVNVQLQSISFLNATTGFVIGWYGTFLRTTDAGVNWTKYPTTITTNLTSVSFINSTSGWAVGQFGKLVRTTNGGVNWAEISTGTVLQLEYVNFLNSTTGTIVGEAGIIRQTTNGGANWSSQTSGTGSWLNGMSIQTPVHTTIVGEDGTIRKTSNAGVNWIAQVSNTANWLRKASFTDTNIGYAVGDNGTIIKTTTGGWLPPTAPGLVNPANGTTCFSLTGTLDWNDVFPPVANYTVQISTSSTFTTITHEAQLLMPSQYTIPSGVLAYNTLYYWRVRGVNQVAIGPWSSVRNFRTTTPSMLAPNLLQPPNNASTGLQPVLRWDSVVAASTYRVRIATDTGFNAIVLDSNNITLKQITVPAGKLTANTRYYWRVVANNSCNTSPNSVRWSFITSLVGIIQNGIEIPKVFALYNNYPNPFNPATTIKFDLPERSTVNITIFDITGRQVSNPVNGQLDAGKYELTWNADNYASGLYLYRVEAVSFTSGQKGINETRKMLLLK